MDDIGKNGSIIWKSRLYPRFLCLKPTLGILTAFFSILIWAAPSAVFSNGLFENRSWQFETTADRVHKGSVLDLIERKRAGGYTTYVTNTSNSTTHYNIQGDYIDCNMTSQALGNSGNVSQDVPVASPTIDVDSNTSSSATGNSGTNSVSEGSDVADNGITVQDGDSGSVTNTSDAGGTNSLSSDQSNNDSAQNSSVTDNPFSSNVSGVSSDGGDSSVALNSSQSTVDSPVSSTISHSYNCDFNTTSGAIGVPINSGGSE